MPTKLRSAILSFCAVLALASALAPASARPITPAERRYHPFDGALPACDDQSILQQITVRFDQAESQYWNSGLAILSYDAIVETGYRTTGLDFIPRRYCQARAIMNDGKVRNVVYHLSEKQGPLGWGAGVEWCVVGLDRHYAFGRNCRAALP
jgi:hypothetical protein